MHKKTIIYFSLTATLFAFTSCNNSFDDKRGKMNVYKLSYDKVISCFQKEVLEQSLKFDGFFITNDYFYAETSFAYDSLNYSEQWICKYKFDFLSKNGILNINFIDESFSSHFSFNENVIYEIPYGETGFFTSTYEASLEINASFKELKCADEIPLTLATIKTYLLRDYQIIYSYLTANSVDYTLLV